ncbi:MAG: hypothetical protein WED85_08540 [Dehalococcoidia bacterium]
MRLAPLYFAALVALAALLWQVSNGGAAAGDTERVSVDSFENEVTGGDNEDAAISADGRYVAFMSGAVDLVPDDNNGMQDAFVRDRQAGTTERVSVDSSGVEGDQHSGAVGISGDGRYVVFQSNANNFVPGDNDNDSDIFVHDRQTGDTEIVSVDSSGNHGDASSFGPAAISADGRYVAFYSGATNLVTGDMNDVYDTFVHDRQTGDTERVSVDGSGDEGDFNTFGPTISSDGRYVGFDTRSVLVPDDLNGEVDVYVHDRQTGDTERVSVDSAGEEGSDASFYGHISGDGRYVAFESRAIDLVLGDTNGDVADIYIHDRQTGETERVSVDSDGNQGSGQSLRSGISGDGRYVTFGSHSALVPEDGNGFSDVYIHDRQTGVTDWVSDDISGNQGDGNSWGSESDATISEDGRFVAFTSDATDLVALDDNEIRDAFVHDLGPPATPTPSPSPSPTSSPTATATPTPTPTLTSTPTLPCPGATAPPGGTCPPCPGFEPQGEGVHVESTCPPTPSPSPSGAQIPWGDNNCSGPPPDPVDSLLTLRFDAGLGTNTGDCPPLGEVVEVANASPHPWGDVDCSGEVNPVDSLKLLRFDAGLPVDQPQGCPQLGATVLVAEG